MLIPWQFICPHGNRSKDYRGQKKGVVAFRHPCITKVVLVCFQSISFRGQSVRCTDQRLGHASFFQTSRFPSLCLRTEGKGALEMNFYLHAQI